MSSGFGAITPLDWIALGASLGLWLLFEFINDHTKLGDRSLSGLMARQRKQWMLVVATREIRMMDVNIVGGLLQGTAFLSSATILAIGGCFALLDSTDLALALYRDLPVADGVTRASFELKVLGLGAVLIYAFLKFSWAFRLFNYCGILIGSVPDAAISPPEMCRTQALRAAEMNIIASRHFTAGLRGIYFALGYFGWFIGPLWLFVASSAMLLMVVRRQFFSKARRVLLDTPSQTPVKH